MPRVPSRRAVWSFVVAALLVMDASFSWASSSGLDTPQGIVELPISVDGVTGIDLVGSGGTAQQLPGNGVTPPNTIVTGNETVVGNLTVLASATLGSACAPNGMAAQNSATGAPLYCISGIWTGISPDKMDRQVFTASGTYKPCAGIHYADVEVQAGGGGGGAGGLGVGSGSGGGGGAYAKKLLTAAQVTGSIAVTVGAAGAGGGASPNGVGGGVSSFGGLLRCDGGNGAAGQRNHAPGGTGGAVSIPGDVNIPGGTGGASPTDDYALTYAAGGEAVLGHGGAAPTWSGAPFGAGYAPTGGYGGGGSGASNPYSPNLYSGGNGAPGIVIVTEYCNQ